MYATSGRSVVSSAQINPGVVETSDLANGAVTDDKVATHTTTKITTPTSLLSGTLAIGHHADGIITPPKLENGTQGDVLYAGASGIFARLAIGTSGYFLKSNGAGQNPSWAAAGAEFPIPSANVKQSANTERTTSSSSYTMLKEMKCNLPGKVRITYEFHRNGAGTAFVRIYKNGVAFGTEQSIATGSGYVDTTTEDLSFESGDLIQAYCKNSNGTAMYIRNFRIAYDLVASAVPTVNTD